MLCYIASGFDVLQNNSTLFLLVQQSNAVLAKLYEGSCPKISIKKFFRVRNSTPPCLLAIPAFDRIAGLYNRHLNSSREYASANDLEISLRVMIVLAKE